MIVGGFSLLLIIAALSAIVGAIALENFWLVLAVPIMAVAFYFSDPGAPHQRWVTAGSALCLATFIELFLNGYLTAAVLVAFAVLTFAVVRIVGLINHRSFRLALASSEVAFLDAFVHRQCTLKENETGRVYTAR